MIGKVGRDQNNCLIPEQLAGPDDGSVMLVHHDTNCEYQLATAVDCFTSRAYLGITCCCKPLYNPSTGALKVDCLCGTATNVDINTNSDSNCNVPILVQGTKTVSGATSLTDTIEKSVAVYNDNCYICNDPVTGCPVCKPVVYIPTVKADEFIGVPASGIQYVNSLPNNPEDTTYGINETKAISNVKLKQFVSMYMADNGTEFVPKTNLISTSLTIGSNSNVNITSVALDYSTVNGTISTSESTQLSGNITTKNFYFGNSRTCEYYKVGSGDGSGSGNVEVQCVTNATGKLPVWDPIAEGFKYSECGDLVSCNGCVAITALSNTQTHSYNIIRSCNSCTDYNSCLCVIDCAIYGFVKEDGYTNGTLCIAPNCAELTATFGSGTKMGLSIRCDSSNNRIASLGSYHGGYCQIDKTDGTCTKVNLYNGNSCIDVLYCSTYGCTECNHACMTTCTSKGATSVLCNSVLTNCYGASLNSECYDTYTNDYKQATVIAKDGCIGMYIACGLSPQVLSEHVIDYTDARLKVCCGNAGFKRYLIEGEAPITFTGLRCEWDALTSTEQNQYAIVNITDENVAPIAVSNCVQSGDQNPVTSDAVYNAFGEITCGTATLATNMTGAINWYKVGKLVMVTIKAYTGNIDFEADTTIASGLPKSVVNDTVEGVVENYQTCGAGTIYIQCGGTTLKPRSKLWNDRYYFGQLTYFTE